MPCPARLSPRAPRRYRPTTPVAGTGGGEPGRKVRMGMVAKCMAAIQARNAGSTFRRPRKVLTTTKSATTARVINTASNSSPKAMPTVRCMRTSGEQTRLLGGRGDRKVPALHVTVDRELRRQLGLPIGIRAGLRDHGGDIGVERPALDVALQLHCGVPGVDAPTGRPDDVRPSLVGPSSRMIGCFGASWSSSRSGRTAARRPHPCSAPPLSPNGRTGTPPHRPAER